MKQFFSQQYWKGQRLLLLAFLLVHIVIASIHISRQDVIIDEPDYYTYAARWLHGNVERTDKMYDSKTPVVAVVLVPRIIKQILQPGYKATDFGRADVMNGRYLMVIFTIIIAIYLFTWIRKLFGPKSWIFPVLFFLFDPLVLSYSMITTSDMASGACLLATFYHLQRFYITRGRTDFVLFSLWVAISLVCKASLLFLFPCLLLLYIILLAAKKIRINAKKLVGYGLMLSVVVLLVINLAYFGKDSFQSLERMKLVSHSFKNLAETPVLKNIPVPLPRNYVQALDLLQYHQEIGAGKRESSYPGVFLNGEVRRSSGFWYYYLYVGFYKIPVAILFLLFAAALTFVISFKRKTFFAKHTWYAWPAVFFFVILSCFNPFQIGIRHLLLIYPLLFVGIAALLEQWRSRYRYTGYIAGGLFAFMIISAANYFPDLIPYTNEFLVDKKNVFRKIKDASIDYGQNVTHVQEYIAQHPGTLKPTSIPKPGRYIVTMADLIEELPSSGLVKYTWLLDFEPVAHYRYSMFIFDISEKDIRQLQQKSWQ
jgi:hypothetical protein